MFSSFDPGIWIARIMCHLRIAMFFGMGGRSRIFLCLFFFSSRRRHTRYIGDWSSDVCSSDLLTLQNFRHARTAVIDPPERAGNSARSIDVTAPSVRRARDGGNFLRPYFPDERE